MNNSFIFNYADEKMISDYINNADTDSVNALLIFNIDNFFEINDKVGRDEGDRILEEVDEFVKSFFKGTDMVVRIGGDEFIALLNNVGSVNNAEKMCKRLLKGISGIQNCKATLTASIGASIYPYHGTDYDSLKNKAIQSLVYVKAGGKNDYRVYDAALTKARINVRADSELPIDEESKSENGSVKWNRYFDDICYSIFSDDNDGYNAINSILEIFCLYYGFNRAFVVTDNRHAHHELSKLEFSVPGYELEYSQVLELIRQDLVCRLHDYHNDYAVISCDDKSEDNEVLQYMRDYDIKKLLYFQIQKDNEFCGGIVFENCDDSEIDFSIDELNNLYIQMNMVVTYARIIEEIPNSKELIAKFDMFNGMDSLIYIVDTKELRIQYMNKKAIEYEGANAIGRKCHEVLCKSNSNCDDCPLKSMDLNDSKANARLETFNYSSRKWSINLISWLNTRDNPGLALIISIDLDSYFSELESI